jgi:hypothetical protein
MITRLDRVGAMTVPGGSVPLVEIDLKYCIQAARITLVSIAGVYECRESDRWRFLIA